MAIQIQWYQRIDCERTVGKKSTSVLYKISESDPPIAQASMFLVCADLKKQVTQLSGAPAKRAYARRIGLGKIKGWSLFGGGVATSYTTSAATALAESLKQTWEIPVKTYFDACTLADERVLSLRA